MFRASSSHYQESLTVHTASSFCVCVCLRHCLVRKFKKRIIKICFKMLCICTTLYTLSFYIPISALASTSPLTFPISFIYLRTVSFAFVSRKLRCHNPNKAFFHVYIHVLSPSHVFSERYDVIILAKAYLISFIYSRIIYFTYIFRMLRCHNPRECLFTV
jgi:hypothetical protein